jgi:hypothetical protein
MLSTGIYDTMLGNSLEMVQGQARESEMVVYMFKNQRQKTKNKYNIS